MQELWTLKETARRTGMSVSFWRQQQRDGAIPVIRCGRVIRLDPAAVHAFLDDRTFPKLKYQTKLAVFKSTGKGSSLAAVVVCLLYFLTLPQLTLAQKSQSVRPAPRETEYHLSDDARGEIK
jgi:hypothetical protein